MASKTDPSPSLPADLLAEMDGVLRARLAHCEATYRNTGEPLAVVEALTLVFTCLPESMRWIEIAASGIIAERRSDAQAEKHRDAMRHFWRYLYVRGFRQRGIKPIEAAAARALEVLKGSDCAHVTVATFIESYWKVRHDLEAGRQGEYFCILDPRYLDADDPN
jgi:hypothetical protein